MKENQNTKCLEDKLQYEKKTIFGHIVMSFIKH